MSIATFRISNCIVFITIKVPNYFLKFIIDNLNSQLLCLLKTLVLHLSIILLAISTISLIVKANDLSNLLIVIAFTRSKSARLVRRKNVVATLRKHVLLASYTNV